MSNIVKDFYNRLPGAFVSELDKIVDKYKDELWFADAWMGYRIHIINSTKDKIKSPKEFFARWIDRVPNANPVDTDMECKPCKLDANYEEQAKLYNEELACCPGTDFEDEGTSMEASDDEPDLVAVDIDEN